MRSGLAIRSCNGARREAPGLTVDSPRTVRLARSLAWSRVAHRAGAVTVLFHAGPAVHGVELPFGGEPRSWWIDAAGSVHDRPIGDADAWTLSPDGPGAGCQSITIPGPAGPGGSGEQAERGGLLGHPALGAWLPAACRRWLTGSLWRDAAWRRGSQQPGRVGQADYGA
jgi:hypothetical protein